MRTYIKRNSLTPPQGCTCYQMQGSNIALGNTVTDFVKDLLPKTTTGQTGLQVEITMNMSSVIMVAAGVLLSGLLIKHL